MSALSKAERETLLNITEADEDWNVYTSSRTVAALFRRRGWALSEVPGGWEGAIPFRAITLRSLRSLSRSETPIRDRENDSNPAGLVSGATPPRNTPQKHEAVKP